MFHMGEGLPKMIESNAVGVCEDSEIKRTCLDLSSMKTAPSCKLSFHIEKDLSEMPYLCIYMKHVDAFTGFDLYVEAEDGRPCTFRFDNKSTLSKVRSVRARSARISLFLFNYTEYSLVQ